MKSLIIVFVICAVQSVLAQRTFDGQCPEFTPLADFDLDGFMKTWWGWEKYTFRSLTQCTRGTYENLGDNKISYTNTGLVDGKLTSFTIPSTYFGNGEFSIPYDASQPTDAPNYAVVGSNYQTWAAVTWCKNISATQHQKIAFVLTSTPTPAESDVNAARSALEAAGVDTSLLEKYDLNGCSA